MGGSCCKCRCACSAALVVRTFHTLLVLGVPASLVYRDTTLLHKSLVEGRGIVLGVLYVALLLTSLVLYFVTCFTDPGYISRHKPRPKMIRPSLNSDDEDNEDDEDDDETDGLQDGGHVMESGYHEVSTSENSKGLKYRLCDYCEIRQPMRAKHCEDCNKCVHKFDHHCPWLEACVGEKNHRYFWLFLLSTQTLILVTLYITWNGFVYKPIWHDWGEVNGVLILDMFPLVIGGLVVGGLLAFHTYLMLQGLTTWEAASRERITYLKYLDEEYNPFNEGVVRNTFHFLCVCTLRRWELLYARKAKGKEVNGVV